MGKKKNIVERVGIIETLSRVVEIEATSSEEAIKMAKIRYDEQEFILDSNDFDNMPVFQDINKENLCYNCGK